MSSKTKVIMTVIEGALMGAVAVLIGLGSGIWQFGLAAFIVLLLITPR
jgi:hypothetical protein